MIEWFLDWPGVVWMAVGIAGLIVFHMKARVSMKPDVFLVLGACVLGPLMIIPVLLVEPEE